MLPLPTNCPARTRQAEGAELTHDLSMLVHALTYLTRGVAPWLVCQHLLCSRTVFLLVRVMAALTPSPAQVRTLPPMLTSGPVCCYPGPGVHPPSDADFWASLLLAWC